MARSLSQILLSQSAAAPSGDALTQAQRGVQTGMQLATINE